jgi:hypothetical protein
MNDCCCLKLCYIDDMNFNLGSSAKILLFAAFFGLLITVMSTVASHGDRPVLLREAKWGIPVPSFSQRFGKGKSEAELLRWLSDAGFDLHNTGSASLRISGIPCAELAEVSWTATDGIIGDSSAVVREAGCL